VQPQKKPKKKTTKKPAMRENDICVKEDALSIMRAKNGLYDSNICSSRICKDILKIRQQIESVSDTIDDDEILSLLLELSNFVGEMDEKYEKISAKIESDLKELKSIADGRKLSGIIKRMNR